MATSNLAEEGKLPELQPGQKLPIKATATPLVAMQFPDKTRQGNGRRSEDGFEFRTKRAWQGLEKERSMCMKG